MDEVKIQTVTFKGMIEAIIEKKVFEAIGKGISVTFNGPIQIVNKEGIVHLNADISVEATSKDVNDLISHSFLKKIGAIKDKVK